MESMKNNVAQFNCRTTVQANLKKYNKKVQGMLLYFFCSKGCSCIDAYTFEVKKKLFWAEPSGKVIRYYSQEYFLF